MMGIQVNSLFTTALIRNISQPNSRDIESIMRIVRQEVVDVTKGAQVPWGNSSLIGAGFISIRLRMRATSALETPAKPKALLITGFLESDLLGQT
ncbi:MAG: hypothetical protein R3D29_00975 [Nitratireductor sp.]